eukprot:UN05778
MYNHILYTISDTFLSYFTPTYAWLSSFFFRFRVFC